LLKTQQKLIEEDERKTEKSDNINFNRKKWRFHKTNPCKSRKIDEEDDTSTATTVTISSAVVYSSVCGGFNQWHTMESENIYGFLSCRSDIGSGRWIFEIWEKGNEYGKVENV
jgi:hypothetical protein